jgi:hypothetical protein
MSEQITSLKFVQKLQECVKEYKKQMNATRDDIDAAHFYNPTFKKFLKDHSDELNILAQMNFDKSFMSWVKTYLFSVKKD